MASKVLQNQHRAVAQALQVLPQQQWRYTVHAGLSQFMSAWKYRMATFTPGVPRERGQVLLLDLEAVYAGADI